jgi:mannan polymerase II complex MNN10 subunit
MSLSRSPSPVPGGGWSSPGLNIHSGRTSPAHISGAPVAWESAKMRSHNVNGYPSFSTQNSGFFVRHMRRLSSNLPIFSSSSSGSNGHKDKYGDERWATRDASWFDRIRNIIGRMGRKTRFRLLFAGILFLILFIFLNTREWCKLTPALPLSASRCQRQNRLADLTIALLYYWRRASVGEAGNKFVIILGANVGGGVMDWKGAREWAIERDSVRNKRKYAGRWGYELEIVDMSTKKRYAHEWRESWEKVDYMRKSMRKYPEAEW